MYAMTAYPTITVMMRFTRRSLRKRLRFCASIRSACSGEKSDFIRGAVFSRSEDGRRQSVTGLSLGQPNRTRTLGRFEKVVGERECDKAAESQDEEREELALFPSVRQAIFTIHSVRGVILPAHRRYNL